MNGKLTGAQGSRYSRQQIRAVVVTGYWWCSSGSDII